MNTKYSGCNLIFEYMTEKDLFPVSRMLEKDSVCKWLFFGPNSYDTTKNYFEPLISGIKKDLLENRLPKTPVFTIKEKKSDCFIGQCALLPVDFSDGAYLMGYQLDDICWGRGFGTEACRFLIYYAFNVAGACRINGDCVRENTASWEIMERCGFKKEGLQREYWHHNNNSYDRILYGLLADDLSADAKVALNEEFGKKL